MRQRGNGPLQVNIRQGRGRGHRIRAVVCPRQPPPTKPPPTVVGHDRQQPVPGAPLPFIELTPVGEGPLQANLPLELLPRRLTPSGIANHLNFRCPAVGVRAFSLPRARGAPLVLAKTDHRSNGRRPHRGVAFGTMEQRLSLITLGVTDLHRAHSFYQRLGWHGHEVQQTVFFQAGGLAVSLWSRDELAADLGVSDHKGGGFGGIALAHNVRSPAEVDAILAAAANAGATITRTAAETFYGGYAGAFCDPDGYSWEIAHNPGFLLAEDGTITLPDFSAG